MFGLEFVLLLAVGCMLFAFVSGNLSVRGVTALMRGIPGAEKVEIMVGGTRLACRVVRDRWWYDTIAISAAGTYNFFETTAGKTRAYQHFEGDHSLVKEREYALIYGMVSYLMRQDHEALPLPAESLPLHNDGSFRWEQDKVVVDEDRMKVLAGGVSLRVSGAVPLAAMEAQPGDGRHDNMRLYTKPKLITGGRSVDFSVTTGTALPEAAVLDLQVALYGLWLIPLGKVKPVEEVPAQVMRARARARRRR